MQLPVDSRAAGADAPTYTPRKTSVGTSPTHVWSPAGQIDVLLVNRDLAATVHVGGPEVDAGAGLPIPPLGSVTVPGDVNWYAVADTAGAQLWAMPGASSYTPSPAEQAAQMNLQGGVIQAAGETAGSYVTPTASLAFNFGSLSGILIPAPSPGLVLVLDTFVVQRVQGTTTVSITDSTGAVTLINGVTYGASTTLPETYDFANLALPAGASLNYTNTAFGNGIAGVISYSTRKA